MVSRKGIFLLKTQLISFDDHVSIHTTRTSDLITISFLTGRHDTIYLRVPASTHRGVGLLQLSEEL